MTDRAGRTRVILPAIILALLGAGLGWLCVRTTLMEALPADSALSRQIAPHAPDAVLTRATVAIVRQHGILDAFTLADVRRAAAAAPLDARPYLILGHQQLLDRTPDRALATFEAGQRLDPRQTLIHLLLLDRYLRTGRFNDVAGQMSVLARLVGATEPSIATAVASMTLSPQTRGAARRAMRSDPALERAVLVALANGGVSPDAIFAIASPAARAAAGAEGGWGPALVNRLITRQRFADAKAVWRRLYGVPADAPAIFNPGFRSVAAAAPFNWTLVAGSVGAADSRGGALRIDYYGRDSGDLATQLLVLPPGRYRFGVTVDPGKTDNAAKLIWSLGCGNGPLASGAPLMNLVVAAGPTARRLTADLTVPAGCPAQTLSLRGEAGDIPAPSSVTVRDPDVRPLSGGAA